MTKNIQAIVKKVTSKWRGRVSEDWYEDIKQQAWLMVLDRLDKDPNEDEMTTRNRVRNDLNRWYNKQKGAVVMGEGMEVDFEDADKYFGKDYDMEGQYHTPRPPEELVTHDSGIAMFISELVGEANLTTREHDVIDMVSQGYPVNYCADHLGITVDKARYAYEEGIKKLQEAAKGQVHPDTI